MTMEQPDLYAILGVSPSATPAQIRSAYRALLHRHHPDTRSPEDESHGAGSDTALQQVLAAYTVLRNPARRADYDRETTAPRHPARPRRQHAPNNIDAYDQPPIVAGPVRWHRS